METKPRIRSRKSELKPKLIEEPVIVATEVPAKKKRKPRKKARKSESEGSVMSSLSRRSSIDEEIQTTTCYYCNGPEASRKGYKFKKCLKCDEQSHSKCITGPKDNFICTKCTDTSDQQKIQNAEDEETKEDGFQGFDDIEIEKPKSPLKKDDDQITNQDENQEKDDEPKLENLKEWTVTQVFDYLYKFLPDHAHLFKDQEIDGSSLVLMGRSDILSGFGLKLGPAMAIYQRVAMMQQNTNDIRITWE